MLYALLALVSAGAAGFFFYSFQNSEGATMYLILGIVFALAAVGLGALFLINKMSHQEEIHVTE